MGHDTTPTRQVDRRVALGALTAAGVVEELKASGFVADALRRHRIEGADVAPAARR